MSKNNTGDNALSSTSSLDNKFAQIEMERLETVDTNGQRNDVEDRLEGSDSEDETEVALLGTGSKPSHQHKRRPSLVGVRLSPRRWAQVKEIIIETAPALMFTTVGLLFTGELLDHVSRWKAMERIDELIIIIPVILNLKGNLEMNLSARLGTIANIGELDDRITRYKVLTGNMALLQVQASVVSFVAAILSFVLGALVPRPPENAPPTIPHKIMSALQLTSDKVPSATGHRRPRPPPYDPSKPQSGLAEFVMVTATGMLSACISSLLLGSFMCTLVIVCRRFNLDPDNIAPPIAACLGDLITLCILGLVSTFLINFVNTPLPLLVIGVIVISACFCAAFTLRNSHVRPLISKGWVSLFSAMFISSATGIILDLFVSRYSGFALLAVIISGLPGAIGAVFVSRQSTTLHAAEAASLTVSEYRKSTHAPSVRLVVATLFAITLPVEILFLAVLHMIGWLQLPYLFLWTSVFFFCATSLISLYIAYNLTNYLWKKGLDPDMAALPIHSSVVDLIAQLLLVLCFEFVVLLGGSVEVSH